MNKIINECAMEDPVTTSDVPENEPLDTAQRPGSNVPVIPPGNAPSENAPSENGQELFKEIETDLQSRETVMVCNLAGNEPSDSVPQIPGTKVVADAQPQDGMMHQNGTLSEMYTKAQTTIENVTTQCSTTKGSGTLMASETSGNGMCESNEEKNTPKQPAIQENIPSKGKTCVDNAWGEAKRENQKSRWLMEYRAGYLGQTNGSLTQPESEPCEEVLGFRSNSVIEGEHLQDAIMNTRTALSFLLQTPLCDELLQRPRFRYIHDLFTETMQLTGYGHGLFVEPEEIDPKLASSSKSRKVSWLTKLINAVGLSMNCPMNHVSPVKIAAGKQVENTLFVLRMLARASKEKVEEWPMVLAKLKNGGAARNVSERIVSRRHSEKASSGVVEIDLGYSLKNKQSSKIRVGLTTLHLDFKSNLELLSKDSLFQGKHPHEILLQHHVFRNGQTLGRSADSHLKNRRRSAADLNAPKAVSLQNPLDTYQDVGNLYIFPVQHSESLLHVERIPESILSIETFPQLSVLSLVGLNLETTAFPEELPNGLPPQLTTLALSNNQLESIPNIFLSIETLRELRLEKNCIKQIDCSGYANLKKLVISQNQLTDWPRNLLRCASLEVLQIGSNHISSTFPKFIRDKLLEFSAAGNPFLNLAEPFSDVQDEPVGTPFLTQPEATLDAHRQEKGKATDYPVVEEPSEKHTTRAERVVDTTSNVADTVSFTEADSYFQEEDGESSFLSSIENKAVLRIGSVEVIEEQVVEEQKEHEQDICELFDMRTLDNSLTTFTPCRKRIEFVLVMESQIDVSFEWVGARRDISFSPALKTLFALPAVTTICVQLCSNDRHIPVKELMQDTTEDLFSHKTPVYLEKVHHHLSIGFHVVNSCMVLGGRVCKFIVYPR